MLRLSQNVEARVAGGRLFTHQNPFAVEVRDVFAFRSGHLRYSVIEWMGYNQTVSRLLQTSKLEGASKAIYTTNHQGVVKSNRFHTLQ
jgi:hypothetical protein